jgi:hypothetical protein
MNWTSDVTIFERNSMPVTSPTIMKPVLADDLSGAWAFHQLTVLSTYLFVY